MNAILHGGDTMRRIAVVVAVLGLFGAARQVSADEAPRYLVPPATPRDAVTPSPSVRVTLEFRILQRELRSGKVKLVAQRTLTHTVASRPDLEFQFEGFCGECWVSALTEVKTDLTETRLAKLELEYAISDPNETDATKFRRKLSEVVELGRPLRHKLRRVEDGIEYLVEIRVKPPEERRPSR
jgi:hypothetical protein